jgi:hypothetical protein
MLKHVFCLGILSTMISFGCYAEEKEEAKMEEIQCNAEQVVPTEDEEQPQELFAAEAEEEIVEEVKEQQLLADSQDEEDEEEDEFFASNIKKDNEDLLA